MKFYHLILGAILLYGGFHLGQNYGQTQQDNDPLLVPASAETNTDQSARKKPSRNC